MTTELTADHHVAISTKIQEELAGYHETLVPCFYAITGSHLYGTASSTSDVDVKGFHGAEGVRYMLFDQPDSQYTFQTQLEMDSFEVEVTSYELRTFGEMLEQSDFSMIELVTEDQQIYRYENKILSTLEEIIQEALPADLPIRYTGMARSLYGRDISGPVPEDQAAAKSWVYALRGCLAAQYVQEYDAVEPKIVTLAETLLPDGEAESVRTFISAVRNDDVPDEGAGHNVRELIENQLETLDPVQSPSADRLAYREALADWMLNTRIATDTR